MMFSCKFDKNPLIDSIDVKHMRNCHPAFANAEQDSDFCPVFLSVSDFGKPTLVVKVWVSFSSILDCI